MSRRPNFGRGVFRGALLLLIVLAPSAVIAQGVPDEAGLRSLFQNQ